MPCSSSFTISSGPYACAGKRSLSRWAPRGETACRPSFSNIAKTASAPRVQFKVHLRAIIHIHQCISGAQVYQRWQTCAHPGAYTCTHSKAPVCMHTHAHKHEHTNTRTRTRHTRARAYVHKQKRTCMHACTYARMHTNTSLCVSGW